MKIFNNVVLYLFIINFFFSSLYRFSNDDCKVQESKYFFRLIIPKINLNQEVYHYEDEGNDVDKGIYLANNYDLNALKGALVLASHSGNSSISYFKNLDTVDNGDVVIVEYDGVEIAYEINKKYKIEKNGKFTFKNKDRYIYLITCDKKNDKKQLVFQGKLQKITKNTKKMQKN